MTKFSWLQAMIVASGIALLAPWAQAVNSDGTWTVDNNGNWSDTSKWAGGTVADGATFNANFTNDITATTTVTLDSSRTIGNLNFSDNGGSGSTWILNSGANVLTLSNGGTSTITALTPTTINAILGGTDNVVYDGAASRTVGGTNTYLGTTLVRNGILALNGGASNSADGVLGNSATAVELGDASTTGNIGLQLLTGSPMARDIHVSNTNTSGGSVTLIGFNAGTGHFDGNVSIDSGQTVNLESDATSVWGGVFSGSGNVVFNGSSAHQFGNAASSYTGTTTLSSGVVALLASAPVSSNGTFGNGTSAIQIGDANSGSSFIQLTTTQQVDRDISVNAAATGTIQIGGGGGLGIYTGTMTLNRNVDLISGGTTNLTGKLTGTGGMRVINGGGTYNIGNATSDYSGTTTISGGIVNVLTSSANGGPGAFGSATSAIVLGDADTGSQAIELYAGANGVNIGRNIHVTNNGTGAVRIGANAANTVYSGDIALDRGITIMTNNSGDGVTFNGVISGVGGIRRNGNSNVVAKINGTNTYTGDTIFDYGFTLVGTNVAASTDGALGNSANAIQFSNAGGGGVGLFTNGNYTISRNIVATAGGSGRSIYLGTYSASGTSNFSGTLALADTVNLQSGGGTVNFTNTISGSLVGSLSIVSGEINLNAANTFTLTSGNYVSLNSGTLGVGNDNALNGNTIRFFNGAMQAIGGNRTINSDVTVGRPVTTVGSYNLTFTGLVDTNGINDGGGVNWSISNPVTTFTNQVSGGYGINKYGLGKLILSGNNTYTGNTSVNQGSLIINNIAGSGTGTGNVTVNNNGTLGGSGFISGTVTVASGGTLAPGNSPGTLTVNNNVSFTDSGSVFSIDLGGEGAGVSDQLVVNGTVTLGNATLTTAVYQKFSPLSEIFIMVNDSTDAVSGTFNGLAQGATVNLGGIFAGATAQISYLGDSIGNTITGGNDVVLYNFQGVPEPSSVALLGLGGLAMIRRRRHA